MLATVRHQIIRKDIILSLKESLQNMSDYILHDGECQLFLSIDSLARILECIAISFLSDVLPCPGSTLSLSASAMSAALTNSAPGKPILTSVIHIEKAKGHKWFSERWACEIEVWTALEENHDTS